MTSRTRSLWRLVAVGAVLVTVAAACGDDDDDSGESTETTAAATETTAGGSTETTTADTAAPETTAATAGEETGATGGELILGAEQWPECINPVTQCANSSWMHWVVDAHVLPRLMELDENGNFVPSPLLAGDPVLSGAGVDEGSSDPFTITYAINPDAVWEDGSPITCDDIAFTVDAYLGTTGTLSTVGWDTVDTVTCPDPKTAVVTWKQPFADWQDVGGGNSTYILKAGAFSGPDLADEMLTEIPFSGGPWILESFSQTEAVLVPNTAYWDADRLPLVDVVRMVPQADSETELNALLAGEVMAIYPQPTPGIVDTLSQDNIQLQFGAGTTYEGLWLNQLTAVEGAAGLLADPVVREALMFAIDRQAILDEVIHPNFPDTEQLNCGGWVPTVGEWCDQTDFADVTYDPARVAELLEGAGWAKGGDGIYEKDGQRLTITWQTVAGNARREAIQELIVPSAAEAGIELVPDNSDPDTLFQVRLPNLDTEMGLYAQVASPDPSVTTLFACDNIPSEANEFSGQNTVGWCDEEATALMIQSDQTPDPAARQELIRQVGDIIREQAVWLPFYQLPLITAWDTDQVEGPVGLYTSSVYSGFANMYDWSVTS